MKILKVWLTFIAIFLTVFMKVALAFEVDITDAEISIYDPVFIEARLPSFPGDVTDPNQIEVSVVLTTPGGEEKRIPAFHKEDYGRDLSLWEARFTPVEEGLYAYQVSVRKEEGTRRSEEKAFRVVDGPGDGFIRKCKKNYNYLRFDSGRYFFGIGYNVPWAEGSSPENFRKHFNFISKSGGNFSRVWMCDWSFPLEWSTLGEYNKESAEKLDALLEVASEKGIFIILVLDTYGSLMAESGFWSEGRWKVNPYNVMRGGPCLEPGDFFHNPEAGKLYKNRLRYIVSRWGYSPNILAFELWNEYNSPPGWTREMASYIKEIDPSGSFVTTSLGYPPEEDFDVSEIWGIEEIDLITIHKYAGKNNIDHVWPVIRMGLHLNEKYSKPYLFSEFGIDAAECDSKNDPQFLGTALHNSLWAALLSGSFGSSMNWWHDTYIEGQKDILDHYLAFSKFVEDINWCSERVYPLKLGPVKFKSDQEEELFYKDVNIHTEDRWGKVRGTTFSVKNNGDIQGPGRPVKYLHGLDKKEMRTHHIYNVSYPTEGDFVIRVGTVSQGGILNIFVNNHRFFQGEFPMGPGEGRWQRSEYLDKYDVYQGVYDEDVKVTVPAGEHTVRISNTGKDWIGINRITLTNYRKSSLTNIRPLGLAIGDEMILWVYDQDSNWKNDYEGVVPLPIEDAFFEIQDVEEGYYEIVWWDTREGREVHREKISSQANNLIIDLPVFSRDIACRIIKK